MKSSTAPSDKYTERGRRLREARDDKGLSRRALAKAAGMTETRLLYIENTNQPCKSYKAEAPIIAKILGVSSDWLLCQSDKKYSDPDGTNTQKNEKELSRISKNELYRVRAERLRLARAARNLSRSALAALSGVSERRIKVFEDALAAGEKYLFYCPLLAEALQVPVSWLLCADLDDMIKNAPLDILQ